MLASVRCAACAIRIALVVFVALLTDYGNLLARLVHRGLMRGIGLGFDDFGRPDRVMRLKFPVFAFL